MAEATHEEKLNQATQKYLDIVQARNPELTKEEAEKKLIETINVSSLIFESMLGDPSFRQDLMFSFLTFSMFGYDKNIHRIAGQFESLVENSRTTVLERVKSFEAMKQTAH